MINKILNEADVKRFKDLLEKSGNIVLTAHVRPDGDALGSTLGLALLLKKLDKDVSVVLPDMAPKAYSFLPGFHDIVSYTKYPDYGRKLIDNADLIVCCDFNKPSRQDALGPVVLASKAKKVLVDHHLDPDSFTDITFSYPSMSSASELMFRIIASLGLYNEMTLGSATALCTGIITDTRNLEVNCSNPDLYIIMLKLMEKGVDKSRIVKLALHTKSYDSVKLQAYAMSDKLEILDEHHTAIISLDKEELNRFHYEKGDSEGLVNQPLEIDGVVSSFFLREDPDCIKVSARSIEDYPVNIICEDLYGGGGHRMASGGEFHGTLQECRDLLVNSISNYDKYLPKRVDKIRNLN